MFNFSLPLDWLVLGLRIGIGVGQNNSKWWDSDVGLSFFLDGVSDLDGLWFGDMLFLVHSIYKAAIMETRGFVWSLVQHNAGCYFRGEHFVGYLFSDDEAADSPNWFIQISCISGYCWWKRGWHVLYFCNLVSSQTCILMVGMVMTHGLAWSTMSSLMSCTWSWWGRVSKSL